MITFQLLSSFNMIRSPVFDCELLSDIPKVIDDLRETLMSGVIDSLEDVPDDLTLMVESDDSIVLVITETDGHGEPYWSTRVPVSVAQLREIFANSVEVSANE